MSLFVFFFSLVNGSIHFSSLKSLRVLPGSLAECLLGGTLESPGVSCSMTLAQVLHEAG